mmetsp:Transcript_76657/g.165874  ORF Transcript_76657/g.165874 Transcript_76657/m.165874 type:complete len:694 (+) Transcript_76657:3096-5177(+)
MPSHAVRRVLRRGDIGAEEGALEGDRPRGDVGALARLRQAVAHGRDRQHAAAVRDDLGVADALAPAAADEAVQGDHVVRLLVLLRAALGHALGLRARVVDGDAGHAARVPEAGDLVPHLVLAGVAAAGHDDRDAAGLGQHPHGVLLQPPLHAALEHAVEVALQQRHDRLRLRVSEAAIELDDLRAVCREHQPGEEAAPELRLLTLHPLDGRHEDLPLDALEHRGVDGGRRREGAHAAGVRALVPVEGALVVLRRRQHRHVGAVGQAEDGALRALHLLLEHDLRARLTHGPLLEEVADGRLGLVAVGRHDDALAGRQAARLNHHLEGRLVDVGQGSLEALLALEGLVDRGGDLVAGHEVLGEGLGGLDLRGCLGRPEGRDALGLQNVHDAVCEHYLGADDHQVDVLILAEGDDLREVRSRDLQGGSDERGVAEVLGAQGVGAAGAAVAGGHVHAAHLDGGGDLAGQGVLARPGAEDQHRPLEAGGGERRVQAVAALRAALHPEGEGAAGDARAALRGVVAGEVPVALVVGQGLVEVRDGLVEDADLGLAVVGEHVPGDALGDLLRREGLVDALHVVDDLRAALELALHLGLAAAVDLVDHVRHAALPEEADRGLERREVPELRHVDAVDVGEADLRAAGDDDDVRRAHAVQSPEDGVLERVAADDGVVQRHDGVLAAPDRAVVDVVRVHREVLA